MMQKYSTVAELLESPERFVPDAIAVDADNCECGHDDPSAVKWGIVGALMAVYGTFTDAYFDAFSRIRTTTGDVSLAWVSRNWTHADLLEAVRKSGI